MQMLGKLRSACLKYPSWKQQNMPHFKPWLFPSQSTLPQFDHDELLEWELPETNWLNASQPVAVEAHIEVESRAEIDSSCKT